MQTDVTGAVSEDTAQASQSDCPDMPEIPGVTGTFKMPVPLKDGVRVLGKVALRLSPDADPALDWKKFGELIGQAVNDKAIQRLKRRRQGQDTLTLAELCAAGMPVTFNPTKLSIELDIPLSYRRKGAIQLGGRDRQQSEPDARPAEVSAYANLFFGIDHVAYSDFSGQGWRTPDIAMDGAIRWRDLVLEGEFSIAQDLTFERRTTRLVYDMPDDALRLKLGDIRAPGTYGRGGRDLLGFSLKRSYSELQPTKNIRPNAQRSFVVYQPSDVDVLVNGRKVRSFRLSPGEYDLSELPLVTGGNRITVKVEEDSGRVRSYDFTVFHGRSLLKPGLSEWRLTGGFTADYTRSGREYAFDQPALSGYYRYGLLENMTGELAAQVTSGGGMLDASVTTESSLGSLFARASASYVGARIGYSLGFDWQFDEFDDWNLPILAVRLSADYDSESFRALEPGTTPHDYLHVGGAFGFRLPLDINGFASFNFTLDEDPEPTVHSSISFSKPVGPNASWSLSGAYRQGPTVDSFDTGLPQWSLQVGFSYRFSPDSRLSADHDFAEKRTTVGFDQSVRTELASWAAEVEVANDKSEDPQTRNEHALSGRLKYAGNRFVGSVGHDRRFHGLGSRILDVRSSANLATAFAFADGSWAWGRPVGGAFAIVGLQDDIAEGTLDIGPSEDGAKARADFWGPALVSGLSPYTPTRIAVAGDGLPPDYDLGKGAFALKPAYKAGYALTAGSAGRMAVRGRLLNKTGEPAVLLMGKAHKNADDNGEPQSFFTGEEGRFFVQGLEPGRWRLTLPDRPDLTYLIELSATNQRVTDVGDIQPHKQD